MDPGTGMVASAGIQAGSQLASGIANLALMGSQQHYQRKMMRYQRDIQKELMAEQNAYNLGMMDKEYNQNVALWNMNNEYNDPAAQRARLEAAGYNPYAMLGQGGAIGTTSSPASSVKGEPVGLPSVGVPASPSMDMSFIGKAVNSYFDSQMKFQLLKEQSAKSQMAQVDSSYREARLMLDLRNALAEERAKLSDAKLSDSKREEIEQNIAFLENTWNARVSVANAQPERMSVEMDVVKAQKALLDEQKNNAIVERAATIANIQVSYAQIKQIGAIITNLQAQTSLTQAQEKHEFIKSVGTIIGNGQAAIMYENLPYRLHLDTRQKEQDYWNPFRWVLGQNPMQWVPNF